MSLGTAARWRWLGASIVAALGWHAVTKLPDHLPEMLWVCHIASLVMAIGLFTGRHRLVAAAFLMHLAFGAPSWALDVIATRSTTPSSVLVHALPLLVGGLAVAARGWPRRVVLPAWISFSFAVPVAYVLTPPALNVNLAHAPWPPLAALLPRPWMSWAFNAGASLILFALHGAWLGRWRPRPAPRAPSRVTLPWLGALALLLLAFHFADHLRRGELGDLLWLSNAATLALAAGCALRRPSLVAVAMLWLCASAILWTADVWVAGSPVDSAVLTHLGSLAVSILAVRALGVPPRSWLRATGGLVLLVAASRLLTAPARNVNLAFAVAPGWEGRFAGHGLYLALLLVFATGLFFVVEQAAVRARRAGAARILDYATIPAFLLFTVAATAALGGTGAPYALISGLVVGTAAVAAAIVERLRPEREEHRAFDQPLRI